MTDTTFVDQQTVIQAAWCNDINDHVYNNTPISPATTVHPSTVIQYTPSGTGAAPTNVQSKLRESASVKDFGAIGNGIADDTAAFAAALAANSVVYVPDGNYNLTNTLNLVGKVLIGGRPSPDTTVYNNVGVLLAFNLPSTTTPAINIGGHYGIRGISATRYGTNKRGPIVNIAQGCERNSYIRDSKFIGCDRAIYGANSANYFYSNYVENIEIGDYTISGIDITSAGSSGNVFSNIYSTSFLSYPTTKNTATTFMSLTGVFSDGVYEQINAEHVALTNAAFLLNGVVNATFNSVHFEGVELNTDARFFSVIGGGLSSSINLNSVTCYNNKCLGNNTSAIQVVNDTNDMVSVTVNGWTAFGNNINATSNHHRVFRGGVIGSVTPAVYLNRYASDLWGGNDIVPIFAGTNAPVLRKLNDFVVYALEGAAFTAPTLQNGWVNEGAPWGTAGYMLDAAGMVRIQGTLKNGTTTPGTLLFTLPAGYRPLANKVFPVWTYGVSDSTAYIQVQSTGAVSIEGGAQANFLSIEMSFLAEQ